MSISTIDVRCRLARSPTVGSLFLLLPSPSPPCMPIRGPPLPRPAATCMIFRLGVRTCELRLRAFIICFYARTSEEDPANTWTDRCQSSRGSCDRKWTESTGRKPGGSREKRAEREKRGHELSKRNNISPEDLFTWRETLPSVSGSGSLP